MLEARTSNFDMSRAATAKRTVVLVVDDTQPRVEALANIIRDAPDLTTLTAVGVDAARAIVGASRPDVVVINVVRKTDTQGWKVLDIVHRQPEMRGVPVVMIVADGTAEDERRALAAGATRLLKTWLPEELTREIRRLAR
jgi:CheY-like chemotaxis protein